MKTLKLLALLGLTLFAIGCGAKNELRIDDFSFGSSSSGRDVENPVLKVGDKVFLNFAIRGMQPDDSGQADLAFSVSVSGFDEPIFDDSGARFKVNSEITSYGPPKPIVLVFEPKHVGKGTLKFIIHDKVADKKLNKEVPYEVTE